MYIFCSTSSYIIPNKSTERKRKKREMKRRREVEKPASSVLRSAIEDLSLLTVMKSLKTHDDNDDHDHVVPNCQQNGTHIPIKPFLSLCTFLLQLLGQILSFSLTLITNRSGNIRPNWLDWVH